LASEKTEGIVLKTVPWSETSSIVTFLTRDFGKVTALAKGAHRPKGPFESALDLLAVCRIVFLAKSGDVLDLLTEAKLARRFRSGQRDLTRLYAGYYVSELLQASAQPRQAMAELFELADQTLLAIDSGHDLAEVIVRFELQLLRLLGHAPCLNQCVQCGRSTLQEDSVLLGIQAGGVLCDTCSRGQRQLIRLHQSTLRAMAPLGQVGWQDRGWTEPSLPAACRGEARGWLQRYLVFALDKRFVMHSYLDDLAR
jgi:DNA repair protein RecO (recombination protein O)